jgi:heme/copper-type cytochrome/quinol oxidase subunit 4
VAVLRQQRVQFFYYTSKFMKLNVIVFVLPIAMTLLAFEGDIGLDHPLFFCFWLLSGVVCLVRGGFIVRRNQLLGSLFILAASIQIFLALPPFLHIRMHPKAIHDDMGPRV